jgi:choline dehydrogenase-like flavoprotein
MFLDFRSADDGLSIDTDLCIIGAGAAGITLAREFAGSFIDVCLLESGGFEAEPQIQSLYEGEITGLDYSLDGSRLRFFGGTTNHWSGRCGPLKAIDFEVRDGIPLSGWPIGLGDLEAYYKRAQPICELGPYVYDDRGWEVAGIQRPPFDAAILETQFWQNSPPTRFGSIYREELKAAGNIRVLLHANAVNFRTDATGSAVDHIDIRDLGGKSGRVKAKLFVLACGGIENPRLLLASNHESPRGLGNSSDRVGRCFMEHPHVFVGEMFADPSNGEYDFVEALKWRRSEGTVFEPGFYMNEDRQKEHRILNGCLTFYDGGTPIGPDQNVLSAQVVVQAEQEPSLESRVTLSSERDALGMPRPRLDWRLGELDLRSVEALTEAFGAEIARLKLGRLKLFDEWRAAVGSHHMGTTRMSDDPQTGVVNRDCRLHDVANLYVAGSSVFSTSGFVNPTLTIVALAVRLADHLKRRFL